MGIRGVCEQVELLESNRRLLVGRDFIYYNGSRVEGVPVKLILDLADHTVELGVGGGCCVLDPDAFELVQDVGLVEGLEDGSRIGEEAGLEDASHL